MADSQIGIRQFHDLQPKNKEVYHIQGSEEMNNDMFEDHVWFIHVESVLDMDLSSQSFQGIIGCTLTNVPCHGKSLYKPCIVGIYGFFHPQESQG